MLRRYPSYRPSGIDHLGDVPSHWKTMRLGRVARLNPSRAEISGIKPTTEVSFLPMEAIGQDGSLNLEFSRNLGEVGAGYTYLREGDVAFAKITPCFENGKGAVARGLLNGIAFGTTELVVARANEGLSSDYLHLIFSSPVFRDHGKAHMYGAGGQKRVPDDFVREFVWALPDLGEQEAIVAFLRNEMSKIDRLIGQQERLIELLTEKRQAVISKTITKGLDQAVELVPSPFDWLGWVPEHWGLVRLRNVVAASSGIQMGPFGGMLKDLEHEPTQFKLYGQENTISGDFSCGTRWLRPEQFESLRDYELLPGDLVLTRKGASIGHCRVVPPGISAGIIDSDTIRVRLNPSRISREYAVLLMHEGYMETAILVRQKGAVLPGLNTGTIANLPVALPPLREQDEIIRHIDRRVSELQDLVVAAEHACKLLGERRAAIITAAVTGKVDVRSRAV